MTEQNENLAIVVVVAVGGTGGIGRHIVDSIIATKKYTVKVFTRQDPSSASDLTAKGALVIKVDYSDHTLLVKELQASPSLSNLIIGVDFNKGEANIVGTGDDRFCLTRGEDVGRFIATPLDLEKWDQKLGMISSRTTWNELIKLGEQVRGKKFNVKRRTVQQAMEGRNPNPPN